MKFNKEQAQPQNQMPFEGTTQLEALDYALWVYGEDAVGVNPRIPKVIDNRKRLAAIAANVITTFPSRRAETLKDIAALRDHISTVLKYPVYNESGNLHLETRGSEVDVAMGALTHMLTTTRDRHPEAFQERHDMATFMALQADVSLAEVIMLTPGPVEEFSSAA
jgi:hypothetical protein